MNHRTRRIQGHQILAINRGEREERLKVDVRLERQPALDILYRAALRGSGPMTDAVRAACDDSYDRLIFPSLERETVSYTHLGAIDLPYNLGRSLTNL